MPVTFLFQILEITWNCERLKKGIKTAENEHELDIIVYATGFLLKENYDFITKIGLSQRFCRPKNEFVNESFLDSF